MTWYSTNSKKLNATPIKGYRMRCYTHSYFVPVYDVPGNKKVYYGIVVYSGEYENLYDIKILDVDSKEYKSLSIDNMKFLLDNSGFRELYCDNRYKISSKDNMVVIDGRPLIKGKYVDHLCYGKVTVKNIELTLAAEYIQRHGIIISIIQRHSDVIRTYDDAFDIRMAIHDILESNLSSSINNYEENIGKLKKNISNAKEKLQMYQDKLDEEAEDAADSLNFLENEFGITLEVDND